MIVKNMENPYMIDPIGEEEKSRREIRRLSLALNSINRISTNEHIAHKENSSTHILGDVHACISCYQTITNPVCERCYLKHLNLWLNEKIEDVSLRRKILNKVSDRVKSESLSEVDCIICGKESVCLCTYCFFFIVENILEKFNVKKSLISDFGETFNYKLYHIRYY